MPIEILVGLVQVLHLIVDIIDAPESKTFRIDSDENKTNYFDQKKTSNKCDKSKQSRNNENE